MSPLKGVVRKIDPKLLDVSISTVKLIGIA